MKHFFLIAIYFLLLTGCEKQSEISASGNEIKIGYLSNFSDSGLIYSYDSLEGVLSANNVFPLLNNGDKLVVVNKASEISVDVTKAKIDQMIDEENIQALLVGLPSGNLLPLKDYLKELKIPVVAVISTHIEIAISTSNIHQVAFNDITQSTVAALFLRDEFLIDNVAVFKETSNPSSKLLSENFSTVFQSTGGGVEQYIAKADDLKKTLVSLKENNISALYLPVSTEKIHQILQLINEIGWAPTVMLTDGVFSDFSQKYPEGDWLIDGAYSTGMFVTMADNYKLTKTGERVADAFTNLYDTRATTFTALGVESYLLLKHGMNNCINNMSSECINSKIRSAINVEGVINEFSMRENGTSIRPVYVSRIDGLEMKKVVVVH